MAAAVAAFLFAAPSQSHAQPSLSMEMLTWHVIGLDSNNPVLQGPDEFLSGARVCNTGPDAANDIVVDYVFDTANPYVDISPKGTDQLTQPFLLPGACQDFYFLLRVKRTPLAYDTTRQFHIEVSASNHATISTPTPRELYVEHLISQNRNDVLSVIGPTEVYVGQIVNYTVLSDTATQGYEQISSFLNFSNLLFQVMEVDVTYTAPPGATNDRVYADACGWDDAIGPTPPTGTYRSCKGPIQYGSGKAGGDLQTIYSIKFLSAGSTSVIETIYDFSGSSYHYNADVGVDTVNITTDPPLEHIQFNKHCDFDAVTPGGTLTCIIEYGNNSTSQTYTGVEINETYDPRTTFVSAVPAPDAGDNHWTIGTLAPGDYGVITIQLTVDADLNDCDMLLNRATINDDVSAANDQPGDPPGMFNYAEVLTNVAVDQPGSALLRVTKTGVPDPEVGAGANVVYTINYENAGQATSYNTVLTDTLGDGLSFVSAVPAPATSAAPVYTWNLGNLAPGASGSITVTATVDSSLLTATILQNQVNVDGNTGGGTNDTCGLHAATEEIQFVRGGAQALADLSITKSDLVADDPNVQGGSLTYTMTVTNAGPDVATNVTVTDVLDTDTTFASATVPCTQAPVGTLTCDLGTLAVGASTTFSIATQISGTAPTAGTLQVSPCNGTEDLCNVATVDADQTDPTPGNNTSDEPTDVSAITRVCDLSIAKADLADPTTAGGTLTYAITVTNNGPDNAADIIIRDQLDPNTTYVSDTFPSGCSAAGGFVTCHYSSLPAGQSRTRNITVSVSPTAPTANTTVSTGPCTGAEDLCNRIVATYGSDCKDTEQTDNTDSEPTNIPRPNANLSITKTDAPFDPVDQGGLVTYTITVGNAGPNASPDVFVTDTLDANTTYISDTAPNGCTEAPAGTLTCQLGALGVSASTSFTVTVLVSGTAPTAGTTQTGLCSAAGVDICNTAVVSALSTADPTPGNDTATQPTNVLAVTADLSIIKSDASDPIREGDVLTYTFQVTNNGPNTANNVEVVDVLDPNEFYLEDTASGGCIEDPFGTVTCSLGSLANGQTANFTMAVFAPTGVPTAGALQLDPCDGSEDLCNNVTVSASTTDTNLANNSDDEPTDVEPAEADVMITKTDVTDPVAIGGDAFYTIVISNPGPDDAQDVVVTDTLDPNTIYLSDDFGCVESPPGTLTCDLGAMLAGQSHTIEVRVNVDPAAPTAGTLQASPCNGSEDICNNVTVATSTVDPDPSNNSDDEPTNVIVAEADLQIDKSDVGSDPVLEEGQVTYTITVTNAGPDQADAVEVTDVLDADTSYVSDTASGGCVEAPAGTLTCDLGNLAVGSTSFTVTVDVDPGAPTAGTTQNGSCPAAGVDLCNEVEVDSATPDPAPLNNTADEPTNVVPPSADVSVNKTDSGSSVSPGSNLTYTINVANAGPQQASNVTVVDTLDPSTTFVSSTGSCIEAPAGVLTCDLGDMAASASASFTVTVAVDSNASESGTLENGSCNGTEDLCNEVEVSADEDDPDPSDNDDDEPSDVATPTGTLSLTKTDDPDSVQPGGTLTYTITISNPSNVPLDNVEVRETYDPRTTFVSAVPAPDIGDNRWLFGTLLPGDVETITITTTVDAGLADCTVLTNTAVMSADGEDDTQVEEETTVSVPAANRARLAVDKSADPASIPAGGIITYTVTVRNTGASTAYDVVLSDVLPDGVTYQNALPAPDQQSGQSVQWDVGDLPPGGAETYQIFAEVDGNADDGTVFENTAHAEGETGPGTNDSCGLAAEGTASNSTSGPGTDCNIVMRKRHVGITQAGNEIVYRCLWCDPCVDAHGVTIIDQVPEGLEIVSVSSRDPFTIDHTTNQVRFEIPRLSAGRAGQAYITVRIPEGTNPGVVLENVIEFKDAALREKTGTDVAVVEGRNTTTSTSRTPSLSVTGSKRATEGGAVNVTLRYRNVGETSTVTALVNESVSVTRAIPPPSVQSGSLLVWNNVGTAGVIKIRGQARIPDADARGAVASMDVSLRDSTSGQVMLSGLDTAVVESLTPTETPTSPRALTASMTGARYVAPGLSTQLMFRYRNLATASEAVITLPTGLTFESSIPAPSKIVGNQLTWSAVQPGSGTIKIRAVTDANLAPGTTLAVGTTLLTDTAGTVADEHQMVVR
ncbi:MAG TPA: hypothetical protein VEC57_18540 [Candidatus Limnocylindrales bacterium]|nr:hypothetical protein [Candidatus Limnocylindrales bacterium]